MQDNRVLIVDALSGTNDVAVDLCRTLAPRCQLTVLTVENSRLNTTDFRGRLLALWPYFGGGINVGSLKKMFRAIRQLIAEIFRHRKGTIHSQFPRFYLLELTIFLAARPFVRRVVFTAHNAVPHEHSIWREALLHLWYRVPHRIIVLSNNVRNEIVKRFHIPSSKIDVIPHGSYVALRSSCIGATPSDRVASIVEATKGKLLIFQFGIIREYKGIDTLIEAARFLPGKPAWHVLVMGGGPPELVSKYQEMAKDLHLEGNVTIIREFLSNEDLAILAERADILSFPYVDISQSGALMLGISFGKPSVCTDIPGFREYLNQDEALFFPAHKPALLAERLMSLLQSSEKREQIGKAAWCAANERYSWGAVAGQYLDSYALRCTES